MIGPKKAPDCSRREFLARSSVALAAGLALPRALRDGQAAAPATIAFEALRRNAGIFTGRGGTIGWLATPDSVVDRQPVP